MSNSVSISIVIRTLNAESTLRDVVSGLVKRADDELIIVDSGSTDQTLEIARNAGAKIVQIPQSEFTYGRSLNFGFRECRNEWVLVLSSHCIPMPVRDDLLELFRESARDYPDMFAAAAGPFHNSEMDRMLMGGVTFYKLDDFKHGFGFAAGNPNCLYRRSRWEEHPFDEIVETAEDMEWYLWALNSGYSIAVVHAASVRYATARPTGVLFHRGRVDRRSSRKLMDLPKVRFRGVLIQAFRLFAYWILRKVSWATARNGVAYKFGAWVESVSERKKSGGKVDQVE